MKKKTLDARVKDAKNETTEAILTILNAITNRGQKKKINKDAKVIALLERYGIEYDG